MYVHCQMGRSRSAAVVIAYLMKAFDASLRTAYLFLMRRRHCSALNLGFFAQLGDWEAKHWGRREPSVSLLDYWRVTVLHLDGASQVHCRAATDRDVARHWGPPDPNHRHHHHEEGLTKRVQGMRFVCNELAKVSPQARDTLRHMELLRSADREIERRRAGAGGM